MISVKSFQKFSENRSRGVIESANKWLYDPNHRIYNIYVILYFNA
jgi:hypothetical protein